MKAPGRESCGGNPQVKSASAEEPLVAEDRGSQSAPGVQSFDGTAKTRGNHKVINARDEG